MKKLGSFIIYEMSIFRMDSEMAKKTFELQNNVELIHSADEIYKYNRQQQQEIIARKPWIKDPHYFKNINYLSSKNKQSGKMKEKLFVVLWEV